MESDYLIEKGFHITEDDNNSEVNSENNNDNISFHQKNKDEKDKDEKPVFKYFTPREVSEHNTCDDLWVSWLGYVYDLTPLALEHRGDILMNPIIKNAGKDISHWFDAKTRNIRMHMNPKLGCICPYTPDGRYLHVPPPMPYANWKPTVKIPWWEDDRYCIGKLSQKTRKIRIINTLTKDEHIIEVCSEESLNAIQDRYIKLNAHAKGYMWKRLGNLLDMNKTLEQNNVKDESKQFEMLGMDEEEWLPVIHIYFSDDLSIA
ncbi:cytochrome b5 [Piromyces finnis]|uniref:Cytochrome b5 domain-containing protein 1 n=1 Tax=Piromyces finnis TaxID=1754191 RepID=A0A1Y1VCW0_9FUNG|nr:cytochrome b5 [Piromyces finnis]|eukprot:ORX53025.1 cytochrome b5 [Piromyces finnis]